jgi:hypothetical protein
MRKAAETHAGQLTPVIDCKRINSGVKSSVSDPDDFYLDPNPIIQIDRIEPCKNFVLTFFTKKCLP